MTIDNIKKVVSKLEILCSSYEAPVQANLEDLEQTVLDLSQEMQCLDLASDQPLKEELGILEHSLAKLSLALKKQQENIEYHVKEISLQQRTVCAYARVANNNLGVIQAH
jgi:hypothetical protein